MTALLKDISEQLKSLSEQLYNLSIDKPAKLEKVSEEIPSLEDIKSWAVKIMKGDDDLGLGKSGLFSILKNLNAKKLSDLTDENKINFVNECRSLLS